ncbi:ITG-like peptide isoform X1 [Tachypleus tridentatus]|uniref:ITG-like peptide isoform X1 n=1 Tax=Tachypleus tridentatus TaxID=6853 RepID=UPI003FCFF8A0
MHALTLSLLGTTLIIASSAVVEAWGAGGGWPSLSFPSQWSSSEVTKDEKKKSGEQILETLLSNDQAEAAVKEQEQCFGKRCLHSEQCCPGSVCVDVDGAVGNCLPVYGQTEGKPCTQDADCGEGFRCEENVNALVRHSCQIDARDVRKKQYNDECLASSECDVSRGLCCQLQRRHRMAPRKVCFYFNDPKNCIGDVDTAHAPEPVINYIPNMPSPFFKARLG